MSKLIYFQPPLSLFLLLLSLIHSFNIPDMDDVCLHTNTERRRERTQTKKQNRTRPIKHHKKNHPINHFFWVRVRKKKCSIYFVYVGMYVPIPLHSTLVGDYYFVRLFIPIFVGDTALYIRTYLLLLTIFFFLLLHKSIPVLSRKSKQTQNGRDENKKQQQTNKQQTTNNDATIII